MLNYENKSGTIEELRKFLKKQKIARVKAFGKIKEGNYWVDVEYIKKFNRLDGLQDINKTLYEDLQKFGEFFKFSV